MENFVKAIIGGMLIGLGCVAFSLSEYKIVGSILFSIGLLTIIFFKQKLYTGMITDLTNVKIFDLISCFVGNLIGTYVVAFFISCTRLYDKVLSISDKLVSIKIGDSYESLFTLGLFCELCIFIAVRAAKYTKEFNYLFIILGVTVFVYCGFEHCIADSFYVFLSDKGYNILLPVTLGNTTAGGLLYAAFDTYKE